MASNILLAGPTGSGKTLIADYVIDNLVPNETKTVDGIDFNLKRTVENGYIIKDISFVNDGEAFHFQEFLSTLLRVILSTVLTTATIILSQYFIFRK